MVENPTISLRMLTLRKFLLSYLIQWWVNPPGFHILEFFSPRWRFFFGGTRQYSSRSIQKWFFQDFIDFFGSRQVFWVYFLSNRHFWEICLDQSKDLLNPCLFRWFSDFKKIPTGLNKSVYTFVTICWLWLSATVKETSDCITWSVKYRQTWLLKTPHATGWKLKCSPHSLFEVAHWVPHGHP